MNGDVCSRYARPGQVDPCEGCGHTALVHPGDGNPNLNACVLCLLLWSTPEPTQPSTPVGQVVDVSGPYPVGTVKMRPMDGSVWVRMGERSGWQGIGGESSRPITAVEEQTAGWPVVGAVPYSPAAAWWYRVRKGRPGGQA